VQPPQSIGASAKPKRLVAQGTCPRRVQRAPAAPPRATHGTACVVTPAGAPPTPEEAVGGAQGRGGGGEGGPSSSSVGSGVGILLRGRLRETRDQQPACTSTYGSHTLGTDTQYTVPHTQQHTNTRSGLPDRFATGGGSLRHHTALVPRPRTLGPLDGPIATGPGLTLRWRTPCPRCRSTRRRSCPRAPVARSAQGRRAHPPARPRQ
jgi:hypothetical protein